MSLLVVTAVHMRFRLHIRFHCSSPCHIIKPRLVNVARIANILLSFIEKPTTFIPLNRIAAVYWISNVCMSLVGSHGVWWPYRRTSRTVNHGVDSPLLYYD